MLCQLAEHYGQALYMYIEIVIVFISSSIIILSKLNRIPRNYISSMLSLVYSGHSGGSTLNYVVFTQVCTFFPGIESDRQIYYDA